MKIRDGMGYLLATAGVVGVIAGLAGVSRDVPLAWTSVIVGVGLNSVSYGLLVPRKPVARASKSAAAKESDADAPATGGPPPETTKPGSET